MEYSFLGDQREMLGALHRIRAANNVLSVASAIDILTAQTDLGNWRTSRPSVIGQSRGEAAENAQVSRLTDDHSAWSL
jgi:hypothetical protein